MEFKPKVGEMWEWTKPDDKPVIFVITKVTKDRIEGPPLYGLQHPCWLISAEQFHKEYGVWGSWRRIYDEDDFTNWALEVRENANAEKVSSGG